MGEYVVINKSSSRDMLKCSLLSRAKNLLKERDRLDLVIQEQQELLKMNGIGMEEPLVDKDGYPLTNVDIYAVRGARNILICAQNDWKSLTKEIEVIMHKIHEQARNEHGGNSSIAEKREVHRTSNCAFARVDKVIPKSPADAAGILNGDKIVQFGSIHAGNFEQIQQLLSVVKDSENVPLKITAVRDNKPLRFEITPKKWAGTGLLGCSILPFSHSPP